MNEPDDRAAIEALHRRDVEAVKRRDYATLASLWTTDGVMMAPGVERLRGVALVAQIEAAGEQDSATEIVDYAFDFEEVEILGDHAIEWGVVRGTTCDPQTGAVDTEGYKLLRVLHREDGDWKIHRAIWNELVEGDTT